jgi:hypothetical protein
MSHRLKVAQLSREARVRDAHGWLAGAFEVEPCKLVVLSYFEKSTGGSQPGEWQASIVCRIPEDENLTVSGYFRWVRFESSGPGRAAFEWLRVTNLTGKLQ